MLKKIVVFASGTGSNFRKIKEFIDNKKIKGSIVLLISNNPKCGAVEFSKLNNIDYKIINDFRYKNEENKNHEYELVLKSYKAELILLAGFMKKIPDNVINIYKNKIMNIHPSMLPKYGGSGFYGMKVHREIIKNKENNTGATVHFVNEQYDKGPIIIQKQIKVQNSDTPKSLASRVLKVEHEIYPKAVKAFCSNKITIKDNQVKINE